MMTRVLGAYELRAPFGALGCGMAMRAVLDRHLADPSRPAYRSADASVAVAHVSRGLWGQAGRADADITRQAGQQGNRQVATYAVCAMATGAIAEAFAALAGGAPSVAPSNAAAPAAACRVTTLCVTPASAAALARRRADDVMAQAKGMIEASEPDDDGAVKLLGVIGHQLAPDSAKRAAVDDLTGRALLDDAQRWIGVAFARKSENQRSEACRIRVEARERLDRAASITSADGAFKGRLTSTRDQLDPTGLWLDFDAAYQTKSYDPQIEALKKIVANPDFRTPEGTAQEQLYAAYIGKAQQAKDAGPASDVTIGDGPGGGGNDSNAASSGGGSQGHGNEEGKGGN